MISILKDVMLTTTEHIDPMYECRCDERLKPKGEESTCLTYTGLFGELEHRKIETRLIDDKFVSVMGFINHLNPTF